MWYFSLYSHWTPRFVMRSLCFALCFSKQKSRSSDRRFHWRILREMFPVKAIWKWRHLFVWILIHCNFFVIRYNFWLKIAVRHKTKIYIYGSYGEILFIESVLLGAVCMRGQKYVTEKLVLKFHDLCGQFLRRNNLLCSTQYGWLYLYWQLLKVH